MLVQYPASDDPQITKKQLQRIDDALVQLEEQADQADQEDIRFRPLSRVEQIADHLAAREAA
jgi:hypothetical protein